MGITQVFKFFFFALFVGLSVLFYQLQSPTFYYITIAVLFTAGMINMGMKQEQVKQETFDNPSNPSQEPLTEALPRQRLLNEMEMATRVQENLLSIDPPKLPGIQIAKRCIPAKSIGGDFYTFIRPQFTNASNTEEDSQKYLSIAIGDVAGHGMSSALIMALSSGIFTEIGKQEQLPSKVLEQSNNAIIKYIQHSHITHVTAFYAVLNVDTKELCFSRAGHPSSLLIKADNTVQELTTDGVFLGMFKNETFEDKTIQLEAGDRLVFYTDGFTETKGVTGEFYGEERLQNLICSQQSKPIGQVLNTIFEDVDQFANGQIAKDDRSIVILEIN